MQDAFGGIVNIVLIALFLIIAEGILGMAVNYTKAFKMKNLVISNFEKYETAGCFDTTGSCYKAIEEGAKRIGYSPSDLNCPGDNEKFKYKKMEGMYCYGERISTENPNANLSKKNSYRIVTQVDINIPIIKNMFGFTFFQVKGDTRLINVEGSKRG